MGQPTITYVVVRKYALRFATFLATSLFARLLLVTAIILSFAFVSRPALPVAAVLLSAVLVHVTVNPSDESFLSVLKTSFRSSALCIMLFLLASLAAIPTAFNPANHLATVPKIIALQLLVILFYSLGRLVVNINIRALIWWIVGVMCVATVVVIEEQYWKLLRTPLAMVDVVQLGDTTVLNRAFLLLSFALTLFLIVGSDFKSRSMMVLTLVLMVLVSVATQSEAARLVIVLGLLFVFLDQRHLETVHTWTAIGCIVLMFLGPFFYDTLLMIWDAGPLADFRTYTFRERLVNWADFSALILDSRFLGRGLNSSKLLVENPSLFTMPYKPCNTKVQVVAYTCAWHPHNGGLEIAADLGFLGIVWFSTVVWKIRCLFRTFSLPWSQRGLIVVVVGFTAITFVADGFWQPWWWGAAAIIALWLGILCSNPVERTIGY